MKFPDRIKKLKHLSYLIERKATGRPESLTERLEISRTTLYEYIHVLEELGAEINYCRTRQSFYYLNNFRFSF